MTNKFRLVCLGLCLLIMVPVVAQNNASSPYSRFGYGEFLNSSFAGGRAMGGLGIGLRTSKHINPMNPATYSKMDSMTFMFDSGVSLERYSLKDGSNSKSGYNGNINYLAIQFPIFRKVAVSLGILPLTDIGYRFGNYDEKTKAQELFIGKGGISRFYGGVSVEPIKNLAFGVNVSYLFGDLTHFRNLDFLSASNQSIHDSERTSVSSVRYDLGMQYTKNLQGKRFFTLGLTYAPELDLKAKYVKQRTIGLGQSSEFKEETLKNQPMELPTEIGVGFTLGKRNKWLAGFDMTRSLWSKANYFDKIVSFQDRNKYVLGGSYTPDYTEKKFFKRMTYRMGINYSNSYFKLDGNGYDEYGVSFGFGIPMVDSRSVVNLSFEYMNIKPKVSTLVKEYYYRVTLSYTFNEMWFRKSKIN